MKVSPNKTSVWKSYGKEIAIIFCILFCVGTLALYGWSTFESRVARIDTANTSNVSTPTPEREPVLPQRIVIPRISVDTSISNPDTERVDILDEYLKKGAVRYPGSGDLAYGNMFLFAHSTGFRVVQNPAYKAFNNLKKLGNGDEIRVYSEDGKTVATYKVTSVRLVPDSEALVRFDTTAHMLTLSTCNTFGKKEERYVVEASFDRVERVS